MPVSRSAPRVTKALHGAKPAKIKHVGNQGKPGNANPTAEVIAAAAYALVAGPEDGEDREVSLSPSRALVALKEAHSKAIAQLSPDLPESPEEQARQIGEHWRVASWFLTRRLAIEAVEMQTNKLPVAAAIATEKHLLSSSQPTSISASLTVNTTAEDLMKRIAGGGK